jgi:hypothetical protein
MKEVETKEVLIASNVRHFEDNRNIFSLSTKKSLTDREASELLADIIVSHLHNTVTNKGCDTLYSYSIEVVTKEVNSFTELLEYNVKTVKQKLSIKEQFYYYLSKLIVRRYV